MIQELDILLVVHGEDSRDLKSLRYLLQRHCPRGFLAWFSHVFSPRWGFYAGEATRYPRRSHIVSTGVTSGVPLPRPQLTPRGRQRIKQYAQYTGG
jgi:hypothetical protein